MFLKIFSSSSRGHFSQPTLYSLENTVIEEEYKDKREGKGRRCYLGDGTLAIFHQDDTKKDE